ncbi:hypothetical protein FS749_016368 [Ceratobasidium sp. UAMH 11750]|nr:hypothetical protein FS749_016368 [Ceratobasidium sp. UAMH 11750]
MLDGIKRYFKRRFAGPAKVNQTNAYRREPKAKHIGLERIIGPLSEHSQIVVQQQRPPSPTPSFISASQVASGSNASLASLASQRPNQPPGTVRIRGVLDLRDALDRIIGIIDRSTGLEFDTETLGVCCKLLTRLLNELVRKVNPSEFSYEFTKMIQDLEGIAWLLSDFNRANAFRQGAVRKEARSQIAKFSGDFSDHLSLFMATCQKHNPEPQGLNMDELRDEADILYNQAQELLTLGNIDQDSNLKRHMEGLAKYDSPILKGECCSREAVPINLGNEFDVYKGQMTGGEAVAIKMYRQKQVCDRREVQSVEYLVKQVALWTSFHHPSVLPCYGAGTRITGAPEALEGLPRLQFYLVSPFMRFGNAAKQSPYVDIFQIIRQVALGIQYLHNREQPCVHGSLRGENVLIKDDGTACINGFGLTKVLDKLYRPQIAGVYPPYQWMAPEFLRGSNSLLKPSCDIWSWATTALELISGEQPYHNIRAHWDVLDEIIAGRPLNESDYPAFREYSPQPNMMWALLQKCWSMKPEDRPTIDQVIGELDLIEKAQIEEQLEPEHQ